MAALRFGAVGLGSRASLIETALGEADVELVGLCDLVIDYHARPGGLVDRLRDRGIRPKGLYADFGKLLDLTPDFIIILTPPRTHAQLAIRALEAGIDVISEIPAACSLQEAQDLVRAVRTSGRRYYLAENCCYWPFIQSWKSLAKAGKVGRISYVEGEYVHDLGELFEKDHWEEPRAGAGGAGLRSWRAFLEPIRYCTHETGPLLEIMNTRVTAATAFSAPCVVRPDLPSKADLQVAIFQTECGAIYKQLCGFSVTRGGCLHYYVVYGARMTLETSREDGSVLASFADGPGRDSLEKLPLDRGTLVESHAPESAEERSKGHGGADQLMMRDFVASLRQGTPPPIDVFRGLDFTLPGICAVESIRKGNATVPVPDPREWCHS